MKSIYILLFAAVMISIISAETKTPTGPPTDPKSAAKPATIKEGT